MKNATISLLMAAVLISHGNTALGQVVVDEDAFMARESEYTLRLRAAATLGGLLVGSGLLALVGNTHPTGRRQTIFGALCGSGVVVLLLAIIPARRRGDLRSDFAEALDEAPPTLTLRW